VLVLLFDRLMRANASIFFRQMRRHGLFMAKMRDG